MSAVCVLTPVLIGSWPAISAAITGAIAAMGFSTTVATSEAAPRRRVSSVEETIENSQVLEEHMARGETIVATKGDLRIEFGRDHRGACTVCVSGEGRSDRELRTIAREVGTKVIQQYTYHKVITELQSRQFTVAGQEVATDGTIRLHVRRSGR